jgi:BNR/Asp-box repeat
MFRHLRLALLLAAVAVLIPATSALAADPAPTQAAITRDGSHDFDFDLGVWHTEITRRLHPLSDSTESMKLSGTVTIRKVWGGKAQIEEIEADGPKGHWEGMSLFLYDPAVHQWSQTFVGAAAGVFTPGFVGSFHDGKGELFQQDTLDGRSVLVRAIWSDITPTSHTYEEDYSADGGKTWQLSFRAVKTKIGSSAPTAAAAPHDGSHDFDFTFGAWTEHSRRLLHPLTGSNDWAEWDGRTVVRKIWGGRANLAEYKGAPPSGPLELIALRVYNPASRQWSVNFATSGAGELNDIPGVGAFKDGRIDFYDQERFNGRAILVRFSVYSTGPNTHVSEQAFSADGGKTWEVNWINHYRRESRNTDLQED